MNWRTLISSFQRRPSNPSHSYISNMVILLLLLVSILYSLIDHTNVHHFVNTHACLYFHTIYLPKTGKYKWTQKTAWVFYLLPRRYDPCYTSIWCITYAPASRQRFFMRRAPSYIYLMYNLRTRIASAIFHAACYVILHVVLHIIRQSYNKVIISHMIFFIK